MTTVAVGPTTPGTACSATSRIVMRAPVVSRGTMQATLGASDITLAARFSRLYREALSSFTRLACLARLGRPFGRGSPRSDAHAAVDGLELDRRSAAVDVSLQPPARLLDDFDLHAVDDDAAIDARRVDGGRSEERRVGKECRSRWSP